MTEGQDRKVEVIFSPEDIGSRVRELAEEIKAAGLDRLLVVAVLKGSFVFAADLIRALHDVGLSPEVDFISLSSYRSATLTLAFSSTDDGAGIRNPYGGYPGYLSLMIKSFNRADEDAWLVGASYDFERIGVPGLSSFINYARGDTPDSGSNASPDEQELDITVDYRFQSELLKGLWLRARAAFVDQENDVAGAGDVNDLRVILNYELPIL